LNNRIIERYLYQTLLIEEKIKRGREVKERNKKIIFSKKTIAHKRHACMDV